MQEPVALHLRVCCQDLLEQRPMTGREHGSPWGGIVAPRRDSFQKKTLHSASKAYLFADWFISSSTFAMRGVAQKYGPGLAPKYSHAKYNRHSRKVTDSSSEIYKHICYRLRQYNCNHENNPPPAFPSASPNSWVITCLTVFPVSSAQQMNV